MELSIPLPRSPSGKIYRWCPVPECVPNLFQLGDASEGQSIREEFRDRVRRQPGAVGTTCPYCGHDDEDDEFTFRGDIKAATEYVEWAALQDVGDFMDDMARDFNRKTKGSGGGLFDISLKVQHPRGSRPFVWREDLLRDITCNICGRAYGVYAVGLFCPDCGFPNLAVHYQREAELVSQQVELAKKIESDGNQELAYRLLGNAHEDVLTAFETYQKVVYRHLVSKRLSDQAAELRTKKAIGNRFQNIERARELWRNLELDPFAILSEVDLDKLQLNIEKRHVVGHNLSMADEAYAEAAKAGEREQPGRTVQLLGDDITTFAGLCSRVIEQLELTLSTDHMG